MEKNKLTISDYNDDFLKVAYENSNPNEFILVPNGVDIYDAIIDAEAMQHQKATRVTAPYERGKHFAFLSAMCKLFNDKRVRNNDDSFLFDVIYHFNALLGFKYPIDYRGEIPSLVFSGSADLSEHKRNVFLSILQPFIFACIDLRKVENWNKKALRGLNKFLKKEVPFEYNAYCTLANSRGFNSTLTDIRFE